MQKSIWLLISTTVASAYLRAFPNLLVVSSGRKAFLQSPTCLNSLRAMSKRKEIDDDAPKAEKKKRLSKTLLTVAPMPPPHLPCIIPGFNHARARLLTGNDELTDGSCVILWMSRDQRAHNNHAILYAQGVAAQRDLPLKVVFNMVPKFLNATLRQYDFMIQGLQEVERDLRLKNIPFHLLMGDPTQNIPQFAIDQRAALVVCDFSPLRVGLSWTSTVAERLDNLTKPIPLVQVDAHNVVPCWIASPKLEYGARTIRTKIQSKLPEFLTPYPELTANNPRDLQGCEPVDWTATLASLEIDRSVGPVSWLQPGPAAGLAMLNSFIDKRLKDYGAQRNDPNKSLQSNLSPYIHFGHVSVQQLVLLLKSTKKHPSSADSFIEEAVVRRELADNFCYYNSKYDSLEGTNDWAKISLQLHEKDVRPITYTPRQMEEGQTHDDLWNAAQIQMTRDGKMHEWSPSPSEALSTAIFLNDKYELDGRDPNGYVGCLWSIGGIHDQGWGERPIFGKIRFMNYEGCKRKFDVPAFVAKYPPAVSNAAKANREKSA